MTWFIAMLKPFLGAVITDMLKAWAVNFRAERGADPALLDEIKRAVAEVQARTDLDWFEALALASERVMSWLKEVKDDGIRATRRTTSRTMVNSIIHLRLNEIWLKEGR